ncbi:zinc finger protein ZAT9-like [Zingiber officinale]|uniref:zinc finger protein ZAT9-like n=1 Tax=Zingiber officinale TaxID=94328 RepID=UPI001C4B341C|nr:zinc finger protein ZAT9-like [Zingiber officinale]
MEQLRYSCNLCFRRFSNGRALGGHMRFHAVSTAAASLLPGGSSASLGQKVEGKEAGASYGLRANPRKSFRLVDPEFASEELPAGSSVVVQDRESDTESPTAIRSSVKRPRATHMEAKPASSFSDTTPEEDVALSLLMLSRDSSWAAASVDVRPSEGSNEDEEEEGEGEGKIWPSRAPPPPRKGRGRYQSGPCKKVFRSYQALGSHQATHKRTNGRAPATEPDQIYGEADSADAKIHECPICLRVFSSGQALGGHKRAHFTSSLPIVVAKSSVPLYPPPRSRLSTSSWVAAASANSTSLFDLNSPATADDEVELSDISDMQGHI